MHAFYRSSFKDMMNDVVAAGACCECGSCVAVCPHGIIRYVDGKPERASKTPAPFDKCGVSEGIGCDVCAAVCPRLWPREPHLRDVAFSNDRGYEGIFGVYRHIFVARTRDQDVLGRAQDGGVVTALLAWAREAGHIGGAVVAAVGEQDEPCFPTPKLATTVEQIRASAGSWYTYCPNTLALSEAKERNLGRLAFVGVPCQITPLRKMEHTDAGMLLKAGKKPHVVARQREFMRDPAGRVAFAVGLFCTEVFTPALMTERVAERMDIPLSDISKVNVKGEVRIYRRSGAEMGRIPLEEAMGDYQRPACQHCGDFSAELADISCGGVGTDAATIVVLRTQKGVELWRDFEASGQVDVWPIAEHKKAWNILLRLARQQRERVPQRAAHTGSAPELPGYVPGDDAGRGHQMLTGAGKSAEEIAACLAAAYEEAGGSASVSSAPGWAIPGDPGEPAPGEKRRLPPPPHPEQGGGSPAGCMEKHYSAPMDGIATIDL